MGHQRKKVGNIRAIEGQSQFRDDELAPNRDLGGDDAGAIAPVVFAGAYFAGREGIFGGRIDIVRGRALVVPPFTAEFAVGVTGGLLRLVIAFGDVGVKRQLEDTVGKIAGFLNWVRWSHRFH